MILVASVWAKLTGGSLFGMAVVGGVAYGYAHSTLFVPGDAESTTQMLEAHPTLLGFAIGAWLVVALLDLIVTAGVYVIYEGANRYLAAAAALLRFIYTCALLAAVAQLISLWDSGDMQQGLTRFEAFQVIWSAGLVVFGLHLVVLALLGWRSSFTPILISVCLAIAGFGYALVEGSGIVFGPNVLGPGVKAAAGVPMAIGELLLAGWLLLRHGVRHVSRDSRLSVSPPSTDSEISLRNTSRNC